MKLLLSRNLIIAMVVIAALAAGTALLAGYVDGSGPSAKATADSKCVDCPKAGSDACCKEAGSCPEAEDCASACEESACAAKPAVGCCQEKAQTASSSGDACQGAAQTPCGAGGCPK